MKESMSNLDKNLTDFIIKNNELNHWSITDINKLREPPKNYFSQYLHDEQSDITYYLDLINSKYHNTKLKLKILFLQFPPYLHQVEGIGFPAFTKKVLPNCDIHLLHYKNTQNPFIFKISNNKLVKIDRLDNQYDLVIARSSILLELNKDEHYKKILDSSKKIINVKTMSYKQNYKFADFYFDEEDFCPPVDNYFQKNIEKFSKRITKKNYIVIPGSISKIKNQLDFFKQINPTTVKNYEILLIGKINDENYFKKIIKICQNKQLNHTFLGPINQNLLSEILCLSKIAVHTMDMRVNKQKKGYPRLLGETVASGCITLANYPITVPSYFENIVFRYGNIYGDLNINLNKAIEATDKNDYQNEYRSNYTFEDFCESKLIQILKMGGIDESSIV